MLDCLSPEELKTEMCAIKLHVQNKICVRHSDALVDNSEICLQRSNVLACGSADTIDNSEIRLQSSYVLACGSADTIDNSEIRLQSSNVSACGSADTIDNSEICLRHSNVSACGSAETIDNHEQQCSICSRLLSRCMFSKRQLSKICTRARKCSSCLQEIATNSGSMAMILLAHGQIIRVDE
jgi:hypothetical protein